jgi:hypothetical protein
VITRPLPVVRKPKLFGQLLFFQSQRHLWCLDLSGQSHTPERLLELRGLKSWLPVGDKDSQRLLWTQWTANGTQLWSGRVQAGEIKYARQVMPALDQKWPSRFSLLGADDVIYLKMESSEAGWPKCWIGSFRWSDRELQLLESWKFVDGIHRLNDNSRLLTRNSRQTWRPNQYRGGQQSELFLAFGDNVERIQALPYSTIWNVSVFNEQIFFCAKPSLGPDSQLFSSEIIQADQTLELSNIRQITCSDVFPFGIDAYSLCALGSMGSFGIVEHLGQLYRIDLDRKNSDPETLTIELATRESSLTLDHASWRNELKQRFFNPTLESSDPIPVLDRLLHKGRRLVLEGNTQWFRRKLAQSLQSSHCSYSARPPANREESTVAPSEIAQWVRRVFHGKLHYLHLSQALITGHVERAGLILDLRGHPGGNRSQLVLAKLGLEFAEPAAWQVDRQGTWLGFPADSDASQLTVDDVPWVVLIDEWTRSDSELLAHAVRSWRGPRSWPKLIGTRTAGEGLGYSGRLFLGSEEWCTIPEYALRLSNAGEQSWLENQGIAPCIEVDLPPERRDHITGFGPVQASQDLRVVDKLVQLAAETLLSAFR